MKLSILIPSLESRADQLKSLCTDIHMQANQLGLQLGKEYEICVFVDNKEKTVGFKRNYLLDQAKGEYTVFIDDDDRISSEYLKLVMQAIIENPGVDVIGIKGRFYDKGEFKKEFIHSTQYGAYTENDEFYFRPPNHLNPMKASISKQYKFIDEGDKSP